MTDTELIKLLEQRYGKVKLTNSGYIYLACPTCTEYHSRKKKRYIYPDRIMSNCWICNQTLPLSSLLDNVKITSIEKIEKPEIIQNQPESAVTLPCLSAIPINQLPEEHPAIQFLKKDHIYDFDKIFNLYRVLFVPSDGGIILRRGNPFVSSAERLIFPVYFNYKMVGWQLRSVPGTVFGDLPNCLRYYHLFNKGKYLYNYDNVQKLSIVVVVEGVKKAWKFPNAVATFGKNLSMTQIQLLHNWKNIIFLFDAEREAQEIAINVCSHLQLDGIKAININPFDYGFNSPDDMTEEQAIQIVGEAALKHGLK